MSNSGEAENKQSKTAPVHNLLAPFTGRFNLLIRSPPRTVPSTASGIQTPPEGQTTGVTLMNRQLELHRPQSSSPIIMEEKDTVWLNCLSMNLAMKVASPASRAAWLTWARTTSR